MIMIIIYHYIYHHHFKYWETSFTPVRAATDNLHFGMELSWDGDKRSIIEQQ